MFSRSCLLSAALLGGASLLRASGPECLKDFHGIAYDETGRPVGMPMGGVGAGTIEITSAGTLSEFRNINNWAAHLASIPGSALWVTVRQAGQMKVYPLAAGKVRFEGNFPFARLSFPDLPVKVTLWAWSPFILHDLRHSAYPAAIFDAEIESLSDQPLEVGLVLSNGTDYADWLQKIALPNSEQVAIKIESSGGEYRRAISSGITFHTHAKLDLAAVQARVERVRQDLETTYMQAYDYQPVDIRGACNRSYVHHPFGDDEPHARLDFSDLHTGRQLVYSIPFVMVDDEANGRKSVIVAGPPSKQTSARVRIGRKADCIMVFGNCAGWANAANSSAEYVLHYADGGEKHIPLRGGYELTDWMGGAAAYCPASIHGKSAGGTDYIINVFGFPTDGSKELESLELRQTGDIAPLLFAITTGTKATLPLAEGIVAMRRADLDRMVGSAASLKLTSNIDAEFSLTARAPGAQVVTYSVATPGDLPKALENGQSVAGAAATVYAIEQRVKLAPRESGTVGLICSWYAPNHVSTTGHRFGHKYEDWFKDARAVADEIARDHDALLTATKRHYDLIAASSFPKWFREMAQSSFYTLPACTWLTKEGITFMYESPDGCALFGTMDVRYYGSFPMLTAFPELDARVLSQFAAVQDADGFIQHDLGGSSGIADTYRFPPKPAAKPLAPKANRHDYDGYWVNLPIKFVLEVARHYQWTGDRGFLERIWPNVKRAIAWIRAQDEDDDGLPETHYGYDGWKMYDKSNYDANQWVAMLPAAARLATDLGEEQYATELMGIHQKALEQIQKHLWTGRYFRQAFQNDTGNNDMVSIIQTAGNWYADILGFDDGVPRKQVRSALRTIDEINGKDAVLGVTDCVFPDGSHNDSWISIGVGIGWNYYYATACMYEGLDDIALRICDEIWRQYTVEMCRLPWCQEEFFHDARKPTCPYWLLRDMRMGAALLMAHAAAGLHMDAIKGEARIRPSDWVWKDDRFTLPIILPNWLGQVKYHRDGDIEVYEITNIDKPLELRSLQLRTHVRGKATVEYASGAPTADVSPDGTVNVSGVKLTDAPVTIRIAAAR